MPDYRRTRDYQPDLQEDLDAQLQGLRRWDPLSGALADRGMDPAYSDRYLASEGSKDTLGSLAETLQNAQSRTESIDAGLGRQQDLIQEQKQNINPLFAQAQQQDQGPGLMDRLGSGLGAIGGAVSSGLGALIPSQNTLDSIGMRLQNMGAAYHGIVPPYLQQAKIMHEMGQANELMQMRREQAAQQLQQQRMAQQEKDEQQALGIWKDPNLPLSMKKKISEQLKAKGNALAGNLARLGDEQLIAEMETLQPFLPAGKLGEIVNIMRQPNADLAPVEQWRDFARDRKKAYGEAQMKSERFTGLLQKYQNGEIDINSPEYDEFKQHVMDREKRQQEAAEMDLKLQTLGLSKKKAEQELAANSIIPQYGPEINTADGKVTRDKFDPQTGQLSQVTGSKPPPISINNKLDMKTGESLIKHAGDMLKESKAKAIDSIKTMESAGRIDKILQSENVNLGPTADIRQYLDRLGQLMNMGGKTQEERVANTRTLIQGLAQFGLQARSLLEGGGSISNYEQQVVERASTGDISSFTPNELKTFIRAIDKQARSVYQLHQDQLKNVAEDDDPSVKKAARFYKVPAPPPELPPLKEKQKDQGLIMEGKGGKLYRHKGGDKRDKNNWELVQ